VSHAPAVLSIISGNPAPILDLPARFRGPQRRSGFLIPFKETASRRRPSKQAAGSRPTSISTSSARESRERCARFPSARPISAACNPFIGQPDGGVWVSVLADEATMDIRQPWRLQTGSHKSRRARKRKRDEEMITGHDRSSATNRARASGP